METLWALQHLRYAETIHPEDANGGDPDATSSLATPSHVKRELNAWADELTHPHPEGFNPAKRMRTSGPLKTYTLMNWVHFNDTYGPVFPSGCLVSTFLHGLFLSRLGSVAGLGTIPV